MISFDTSTAAGRAEAGCDDAASNNGQGCTKIYMSSQMGGFNAKNCFDGDAGTFCATAGASAVGEWIEIDFGSPVIVTGIRIKPRGGREMPLYFFVHNAGPHAHPTAEADVGTATFLAPPDSFKDDPTFDPAFQPDTTCAFDCRKAGGCYSYTSATSQNVFPSGSTTRTADNTVEYTVTCDHSLVGQYLTIVGGGDPAIFDPQKIQVLGYLGPSAAASTDPPNDWHELCAPPNASCLRLLHATPRRISPSSFTPRHGAPATPLSTTPHRTAPHRTAPRHTTPHHTTSHG